MITYDDIKAACSSVEEEYKNEIRPLIRDFVKTWHELYAPFNDENIRSLANKHRMAIDPPGLDFLGLHTFTKLNGGYIPEDLYGLDYWLSAKMHTKGGTIWDLWNCGRNSLLPIPDCMTNLKQYKELFKTIRTEHEMLLQKLPEITRSVNLALAALNRFQDEDEAEFRALFGQKQTAKKFRVKVIIEEV